MHRALENPVFLLGMPRSGTTWLSQIFESAPDFIVRLSPPYSNDFRGRLTQKSDREDWLEVLRGAIGSNDSFLTQNWRRDTGELKAFDKDPARVTHLAVKDTRFHELYQAGMSVLPAAKLVYIVRHPAAALWSWRNCKEFPRDADFQSEWLGGQCRKNEGAGEYWGFEDWAALSLAYLAAEKMEPHRYRVVRYENLVKSAVETARDLFDFCDVPMRCATVSFINESQTRFDARPYSVFKGGKLSEEWRDEFPKEILAQIEHKAQNAGLGELLS